jgi:hypothetical protein
MRLLAQWTQRYVPNLPIFVLGFILALTRVLALVEPILKLPRTIESQMDLHSP